MSVGLAGSKVVLLIGAGAVGSVILNNPYLGGVFKDVAEVLIKHLKSAPSQGGSDDGAQSSESTAALSAQVMRLTQELRQLATMRSNPVIISQGNERGGSSVMSIVVPVAVLGAAGYSYMWWNNLKLSDFMYVTRRGMKMAVESFNSQMGNLTTALSKTRQHLTQRLDGVSKDLSESLQVQLGIKKDVSSVHREVTEVSGEVRGLRGNVTALEGKVDKIQHSSLIAAQGILMLLNVVSENNMLSSPDPNFRQNMQQLSRLTSSSALALPGTNNGSLGNGLGGLKDFSIIATELESSSRLLANGGSQSARRMIGLGSLDEEQDYAAPSLVHRSTSASSRLNSRTGAVAAAAVVAVNEEEMEFRQGNVQIREVAEQDDGRRRSTGHATGDARQQQERAYPTESTSSFTQEDLSFPPRNPRASVPSLVSAYVAPQPATSRGGLSNSQTQRMLPPVNLKYS